VLRRTLSHRLRPSLVARLALGSLVATAALAVACSGDDGIRISAITGDGATGTATVAADSSSTPDPEGTVVPLPKIPDNPFASGREVGLYLAGGKPDLAGCLPELVSAWGMAPEIEGVRCLSIDIDGDREDEYLFLVTYDVAEGPRPSDLWIYEGANENFRFFNSARALANALTSALEIREVADFTGDGLPEVVATWQECDASSCLTQVLIASNHNGVLENLAPSDAGVEEIEDFEIVDRQIRITGTLTADPNAGPQRTTTRVIAWAGSRFRASTEPGEATYLVHLVNDADRAYNAGNYAEARALYLDAAANNTLPDWKAETGAPAGRSELQAYSLFRAGLSAQREGNSTESTRLLERASLQYPGTMHGSIAARYLAALDEGGSAAQACAATEAFISSFQGLYVDFWDYGSANPERTVFSLCR
jgi:hypothetical protein